MDKRLELRVDQGLLDRIDAVRGDASRSLWIRRVVEQALGEGQAVSPATKGGRVRVPLVAPAPAESPHPKPPVVPGLRRASSLVKDPAALERQRKLNEGKS